MSYQSWISFSTTCTLSNFFFLVQYLFSRCSFPCKSKLSKFMTKFSFTNLTKNSSGFSIKFLQSNQQIPQT
ncbi:unnamed protein product [Coffea canephora]|uniref:DH200=94 genomic scaffold, scaffold_2041 n=1 Tax=Coffea canephora TaxID=49390 RepID=A0A068VJA9_COFCA|nr:unnamed protein product [Coffea canephora]